MRNKERLLRQVSWCLMVSTLLFLGDAGAVQAQQSESPTPAQNGAAAQSSRPSGEYGKPSGDGE